MSNFYYIYYYTIKNVWTLFFFFFLYFLFIFLGGDYSKSFQNICRVNLILILNPLSKLDEKLRNKCPTITDFSVFFLECFWHNFFHADQIRIYANSKTILRRPQGALKQARNPLKAEVKGDEKLYFISVKHVLLLV